jgi:hypothetical protein
VSTTRHISINCCQSQLLRAKRETCSDGADLAETHLRHHPFESGALDGAAARQLPDKASTYGMPQQLASKVPRIGILWPNPLTASGHFVEAFRQGLRESWVM